MEEVLTYLDKLNIEYELITHKAVYTTAEADEVIAGREGIFSKSIFMSGKKNRNYYLFLMDENKRLNISEINNIVGDKLHFAKEEDLYNKLGLTPGSVTVFGLLNNEAHDVRVYVDKDFEKDDIISFHPNINTATVFIKVSDMFKFIESLDYDYKIIDLN